MIDGSTPDAPPIDPGPRRREGGWSSPSWPDGRRIDALLRQESRPRAGRRPAARDQRASSPCGSCGRCRTATSRGAIGAASTRSMRRPSLVEVARAVVPPCEADLVGMQVAEGVDESPAAGSPRGGRAPRASVRRADERRGVVDVDVGRRDVHVARDDQRRPGSRNCRHAPRIASRNVSFSRTSATRPPAVRDVRADDADPADRRLDPAASSCATRPAGRSRDPRAAGRRARGSRRPPSARRSGAPRGSRPRASSSTGNASASPSSPAGRRRPAGAPRGTPVRAAGAASAC